MTRWVIALMLAICLVVGGGALVSADAQDKSKQASDRAAKDYLQSGLILAGEGRDAEAVNQFRQAVSIKPDWAEARSLLGSALARAGNYREAEEELRKAVTLKPDYGEGWNFLGQFLQERGKDKEAQEAFRKAKQFSR